jgi:membrane fusion protein (multidrug efflux system)
MSSSLAARDTLAGPARGRTGLTRRRIAAAGTALALLAGGGWYGQHWWRVGRFVESTDDAYVGGNVTAIAPHVAGFVAEVLVADNQRVQAGQVLIRLDPRDWRAALDHAEAVLATRQAALESARARAVQQQSAIAALAAERDAKSAAAAFATTDAARYRGLATSSAVSRQDAERSDALDRQARAGVAAAEAALAAARQQMQVLAADIVAAQAAVAQAAADRETAQLDLGYTEIRAPIDGYVGNRAAQVGAWVTAGSYLLAVIPARGLWIDANFKEDQLARMRPGQTAHVVADVIPGHPFHGHVASLAPGTGAVFSIIPPENATGNFTRIVQRVPVRIALDPDDAALALLRPGLSATVGIDTRAGAAP